MAYRKSIPLDRWLNERRDALGTIEQAHLHVGEVDGPGPPLAPSRPLGHAYILRAVAEFQGFVRDVHDLAVSELLKAANPPDHLQALLTRAMTRGRSMDSNNATLKALRTDFDRLGLGRLEAKLAETNPRWDRESGPDLKQFEALLRVRNALAHGNDRQVKELRRQGHLDTLTWGRNRVPMLTRGARALDRVVWHHLAATIGGSPW